MLTPGYLDVLPDDIVALYHQLEDSVIKDIARRLSKMNYATDTAAWQAQRISESGALYDDVLTRLAETTGKSEKELRTLFERAGVKTIAFDDAIYKAAGLNPLPLNLSPAMANVLRAGLEKTNGVMRNLTQTIALTSQAAFIEAADLAYLQISSGAFSYQDAIKQAVTSVADQGSTVIHYASGHKEQLDVAVRRTTLTGVNQTSGKLQEARADEMGADLVQTSAHIGARNEGTGPANHEGWQGRIFSRSGTSEKFPDFVETTGYGTGPGLMGWNCRHSWFPFFEGISATHYTQAELDDYANKTVEVNGKQISVYEATQRQRAIERRIRKTKREAGALEAAGLDNTAERLKLGRQQGQMRDFVKESGLQRQRFREQALEMGNQPRALRKAPPKTPVSEMDQFIADNRRSLERAENISPATLHAGAEGDLSDYMYNFFAYDDSGTPIFSDKMLGDTKNDLLYNIHTLGKGNVSTLQMYPAREKAAALLSGNTQLGGKVFSLKERRILERLASADDNLVFAEIDKIRDRRLRGALGGSGGSGRRNLSVDRYRSAQEEDALKNLRENAPGWRG